MKNKTKIVITTIAIFLIVIVSVIINNNMKLNKSLIALRNDAFIDYIIKNDIEKNRNINKICEVIVESYKEIDELYIKELGENIFSSTFDAYSGEYKLSKGMKNLSNCVINSEYVKNMNFEDKMKIKILLHSDIDALDDYDFGFIKFDKKEIETYIKNNQLDVITEYNKGGYYDLRCPSDSKKSIPIPHPDGFAPTIYIETYEYKCCGDLMEEKYSYLKETPPLIYDENENSYVKILYKNNYLFFTNLEEAKKFKYTQNYAFEYKNYSIYAYALNGLNVEPVLIYNQ